MEISSNSQFQITVTNTFNLEYYRTVSVTFNSQLHRISADSAYQSSYGETSTTGAPTLDTMTANTFSTINVYRVNEITQFSAQVDL